MVTSEEDIRIHVLNILLIFFIWFKVLTRM